MVAVLAAAMLGGILAGIAWLVPTVAAWAHSGRFARLGVIDALAALIHGRLWSGDPASAYPPGPAALMPGARGFWIAGALTLIGILAGLGGLARAVEVRMSRPAADRRWWQLRGRRPHEFARYRTARELMVDGPAPDRVVVGRFGRPGSLVAVTGSAQIAVLAAPRTGKSSGLVIPAILEHRGPVVTTSVRTDIAEHTIDRRRRIGRVWVWDPFGARSDAWDLLQGCENWEHALLVARWLGHARKLGDSPNKDYFDEEAEGLVAPYLHAAALTPDVTAAGVYRWILDRDDKTAAQILADVGATDACERLKAVYSYTERQRDGIIGTAAVQLKAYGHPAATRTARRGEGVTPEALFGGPNTLYIVAGRDHQQLLAPLVVTMISSLLYWIGERENRMGHGLSPPALFALDETASIAPIQDLPQILATSLGSGARFMTVWHSVSQIRRYFGADAAAEILALSQAKIFMGSITDQHTRREIVDLLGHRQLLCGGRESVGRVDVMSAQALQRTTAGEGLLINADLPPLIFRQRRHYIDRDLRRLKGTRMRGDGVSLFVDEALPDRAGLDAGGDEHATTSDEWPAGESDW
jgi:type IV secretion system protein VirD4